MKKTNSNIHTNTINAEIAAKEAEARRAEKARIADEQKAEDAALVAEIIARENGHKGEPTNGIFETVKLFQEGRRFNVKLQVLVREPQEDEDLSNIDVVEMPLGCASNAEDAQSMVDDLRPYAPKGRLLTQEDVRKAICARMRADRVAADIFEAGENPEKKIVVDGIEYFTTNGNQVRRAEDSKLILEDNNLAVLLTNDELIERFVAPAIREALAKLEPKPVEKEEEGLFDLYLLLSDETCQHYDVFNSVEEAEDEAWDHEGETWDEWEEIKVVGFEIRNHRTDETVEIEEF